MKLFSRKALWIYLLIAATATFAGCSDKAPENNTPEPILTPTSELVVWFEAEGGDDTIYYTIENPIEGTNIEAIPSVEWISITAIDDAVHYSVAQNITLEERRGVISVEYGSKRFNVAVMQRIKQNPGTITEGLSTLTSDHYFDIQNGLFVGAYVGDLMSMGCNTCQVFMYEELDLETGEEFGDTFQIDLQLPYGSSDICGTYTPGISAGHFIPGSANDLGGQYMQQNSWYIEAGYTTFAPLINGEIKVEKDGYDIYTFTINCTDEQGYKISGTFRGTGQFIEW